MGCCISRTDEDTLERTGQISVPRGGNKPFTKKGVTWTSDTPITKRLLKQQCDAFWDTAPTYEGRLEIWQGLRCACESEDLVLAQAILDSANITIPTGNLADGCYDELGNRYVIPPYCLVEPTNLIKGGNDGDAGSSDQGDDMVAKLLSEEQAATAAALQQTVTIRLSNTAKDVRVNVNLNMDTIVTLRAKLCVSEGLDGKKFNVRFFFLGRLLEDKTKLSEVNFENGQVLQALITEKS